MIPDLDLIGPRRGISLRGHFAHPAGRGYGRIIGQRQLNVGIGGALSERFARRRRTRRRDARYWRAS